MRAFGKPIDLYTSHGAFLQKALWESLWASPALGDLVKVGLGPSIPGAMPRFLLKCILTNRNMK